MTKKQAGKTIPKLIAALEKQYGKQQPPPQRENLLDHFILLMLLEHTSLRRAERAFRRTKTRFVDWNEVRVSTETEILEVVEGVHDAHDKVERVRNALEGIFQKQNLVSLDNLSEMEPDRALRHLTSIRGVEWKDAAQFMLAHYDHPVLPVDKAVARVAQRIGLCDGASPVREVHESIGPLVPKRKLWTVSRLLQQHASDICTPDNYRCDKCVLAKVCEHAAAQAAAAKTATSSSAAKAKAKTKTTTKAKTRAPAKAKAKTKTKTSAKTKPRTTQPKAKKKSAKAPR